MADNGRFERDCAALMAWRTAEDVGKLRTGIRVARMHTFYGGGVIQKAASDSGYDEKTLYARRDVALFILQYASALGNFFSARSIFENQPITYTHYRIALPREGWDIEDAIDSLMAITDGDTLFEEWLWKREGRKLILPMTTRQFGQYISYLRGGRPRPRPIFEGRGSALDVLKSAWSELVGKGQGGREVKLTIKEPR
jgi:hypothetical protein